MRNRLLAAMITGLAAAPAAAQQGPEVDWFGFAQITAETTGEEDNGDGGGIAFGADRVRIGNTAQWGNGVHAKLQVDFNAAGVSTEEAEGSDALEAASNTNQLPNIIKDAVVGYRVNDNLDLQAGMRKMPVGMDFNTSGKRLDIPKRSMEKALVLERSGGAFLFGEAPNVGDGELGYALAVANPATRSGAVEASAGKCVSDGASAGDAGDANQAGTLGEDNSYAGRLSYQAGPGLYAEGYYGGSNVQHVDGRDRNVWYVHGGYMLTPGIEGVIRHYSSHFDGGDVDATLGETWLGANFFLNPQSPHQTRIQLALVVPSGDTAASDYDSGQGPANYHRTQLNFDKEDEAETTFLAQFQASF